MREDSNSSDLKRGRRKVFEDGGGGLTIVPVAEFPNLKRVVNFIYEGQISFGSQEELNEFSEVEASTSGAGQVRGALVDDVV